MKHQTKAYIALIFICFAWGTTYLAIKVGVMDLPSFLFAGVRQVVAGLLIMAFARRGGRPVAHDWGNLKHQMLVGFLMITIGNGLVSWAEQYVPSGVAAVICGMMPICAVAINLISGKGEKVNALVALGLVLGFGGVMLQFRNNLAAFGDFKYTGGILGLLLATSSWALGSILNKRRTGQTNPVYNSGLQLFSGGAFMLVGSPLIDDYGKANFHSVNAYWALLYLIIVGSVLAYTAYMYALKELPVGIVTIYAYINPLVAVLLGFLLLGEQLTVYTGLAFAAIMLGVFLVNQGYRLQRIRKERLSAEGELELLETGNTTVK